MLKQECLCRKFIAMAMLLTSMMATNVWAHGGVAISIDTCRIPVGDAWVHFTGYTPTFSADTEYCNTIPNIGYTNLVFDYEDRKLSKLSVEFEITQEPEGKRVYYQEPSSHKTGTINAVIDFSKEGLGEGKYLAHVTLVNEGEKIDAHLAFKVTPGGGLSGDSMNMVIIMAVLSGLAVVGYMVFKKKDETEAAA